MWTPGNETPFYTFLNPAVTYALATNIRRSTQEAAQHPGFPARNDSAFTPDALLSQARFSPLAVYRPSYHGYTYSGLVQDLYKSQIAQTGGSNENR